MRQLETEVCIVGAGAAGLAAARMLTAYGVPSLILEASPRVGGRIRTLRQSGWELPIELGAEFVHGRPSPTLAVLGGRQRLAKVPEKRVCVGRDVREMPDTWRRFAELLGPASDGPDTDSVLDYLRKRELDEADAELVRLLVEGYHAAPLADVSARSVGEDARDAGVAFEQHRIEAGQDAVLAALEHGIRRGSVQLELGARVTSIEWSAAGATLTAACGEDTLRVSARRCLVTVSIGVLQDALRSGSIRLEPAPARLRDGLSAFAMGSVVKVVLRFEQAPWPENPLAAEASFLHAPESAFRTIWRQAQRGQEQVTLWAGGPRASELASNGSEQLVDLALRSLAEVSGRALESCRRALIEAHHHDFIEDPLTRGAYSYLRPGGGNAAHELAEPFEGTLFFAGEALDIEYPSTVAGALGSGERAARKILSIDSER